MSKRHICKSKFHVSSHFLDMKIPEQKPSCPKHPKIIEIKNGKILFLHFFVESQKGFIFLRHQKEV